MTHLLKRIIWCLCKIYAYLQKDEDKRLVPICVGDLTEEQHAAYKVWQL